MEERDRQTERERETRVLYHGAYPAVNFWNTSFQCPSFKLSRASQGEILCILVFLLTHTRLVTQ